MGDGEDAFWFDGGTPALDFVGTAGLRRGELLDAPERLAEWLVQAGLTPRRIPVDGRGLRDARVLRSAMTEIVLAIVAGRPAPEPAIAAVNAAARRPPLAAALVAGGTGFEIEVVDPTPRSALATLAGDLVRVVGGPSAALLRSCAATDCSGVFLDTSRGGRRRWCSSTGCGNRTRVADHRGRRGAA